MTRPSTRNQHSEITFKIGKKCSQKQLHLNLKSRTYMTMHHIIIPILICSPNVLCQSFGKTVKQYCKSQSDLTHWQTANATFLNVLSNYVFFLGIFKCVWINLKIYFFNRSLNIFLQLLYLTIFFNIKLNLFGCWQYWEFRFMECATLHETLTWKQ